MAGRLAGLLAAVIALTIAAGAFARAPAGSGGGVGPAQLRSGLAAQMRAVGGGSGAYVVDLSASGSAPLFSWASGTPRMLASNTKLFTTAALLQRYGPQTTFGTKVWAIGKRSGPGDHVLDGSLGLVGAGDPTLADAKFARKFDLPLTNLGPLVKAVVAAGITRVRGGIRADAGVFDGRRGVPQAGITGGPFLGSLSGLDYDSGFVHGHLAHNPPRVAAHAFERKLEKAGVTVRGPTVVGGVSRSVRRRAPLGTTQSPPVGSLIKATNTPSNDFFAEMLLKRLAAGGHHRGTTARGAGLVEQFADRVGSHIATENGSGLSRGDRASPRDVVHLLAAMQSRRDGGVYRRSLAVPCKSGTLAQRMCGTAAEGHCHAKTGTLSDVSALSGYCEAREHHLIAFSLLMNGVNIDAAHVHQDRIASLIARYQP